MGMIVSDVSSLGVPGFSLVRYTEISMPRWLISIFFAGFLFCAGLSSSGQLPGDRQQHNALTLAYPASQIWHQAAHTFQGVELQLAALEPTFADTPLDVPELLIGLSRTGFSAVSSAARHGFDRDALPLPFLERPQRPPRSSGSLV